jgi:hypothetical protein
MAIAGDPGAGEANRDRARVGALSWVSVALQRDPEWSGAHHASW